MTEGGVWEIVPNQQPKMLNPAEDAHVRKVSKFGEGAQLREDAHEEAQPLNMSTFGNIEHLRESGNTDEEVF